MLSGSVGAEGRLRLGHAPARTRSCRCARSCAGWRCCTDRRAAAPSDAPATPNAAAFAAEMLADMPSTDKQPESKRMEAYIDSLAAEAEERRRSVRLRRDLADAIPEGYEELFR